MMAKLHYACNIFTFAKVQVLEEMFWHGLSLFKILKNDFQVENVLLQLSGYIGDILRKLQFSMWEKNVWLRHTFSFYSSRTIHAAT